MGEEPRKTGEPRLEGGRVDGSDRDRYQRALYESEERFRRLAEASYEGVAVLEGPRIVDANPQAAAMLGYALSEYIGMSMFELIAPESREEAGLHMQSQDERPWEGLALNKDGSTRLVEVRPRVVLSGERARTMVVFRDVGERRLLEERLRETEKMQVIGRLAGSVAHDFNNLLTVILGCAHLLEKALPDDHPSHALASEISDAGGRAAALTRQLLAYSRRQVLDLRVLDINEVISDTRQMLQRLLGESVRLSMRLAADLGQVRADSGQIEQVLMNLCTNARDAMPDGGEIVVQTETLRVPHGQPSPGRWVHLSVADRGAGMPPATLSRAFEPLFTTKELGRGTGLGLSTVRAIVTQNGGHVTIESEVGRGTTVHVWLPALEEPHALAPALAPEAIAPRGNEVVMLIDDDASIRGLCDSVLRSLGYSVLVATPDSAERLVGAHRGAIDLLVSDVVMPGIRGPAVAALVKASSPDARVLYVSGYLDDHSTGHLEGMAFLAKPFTPLDLARKVREVLDA